MLHIDMPLCYIMLKRNVKMRFLLLVLMVLAPVNMQAANPPNIIFILADDLGWDDPSFHGSQQIPTPNLDTLAYDGVLLSNYYVQPICTPTRAALLTGRHPVQLGLQQFVIESSAPYGLPLNETIMPQYLSKLGYKSHAIGKWHLGFFAWEYTPTYRGFDSHYGFLMGKEDYWDHTNLEGPGADKHSKDVWGLDFRRNKDVVRTDFGRYSTELFSEEAERIIEDHNTTDPLYIYLPFQAVHNANNYRSIEAPDAYKEKFNYIKDEGRRTYAAMLSCLDSAVGNITKALEKKGILDNTIIVFSTDNGGPPHGDNGNHASNFPLRGTKYSYWEGGVRGDGFIWSPLLKKSQYTSNIMMQVTDWLPTLLSAAGYDMESLPKDLYGVNQWPYLMAGSPTGARQKMLHNIDESQGAWAVRAGDMKLMFAKGGQTVHMPDWYKPESVDDTRANHNNGKDLTEKFDESAPPAMFRSDLEEVLLRLGRKLPEPRPFMVNCGPKPADAATNCKVSEKPCLYNITADPCEYHNLADKMPDVVQKLHELYGLYNMTTVPPLNKPCDPAGFPVHHNGIWEPWIKLDHNGLPNGYI